MPQKKDPDSTPSTKILALYTLLFFQPRAYSLTDLAGKLHCSKQTVLRLCTQLECFAAEFRTEMRGRERWYWLEHPPQRPALGMAPGALNCLALCKNLSAHLLPQDMARDADLAIERASTLLADLARRAEAMDPPVGVRGKGFIDYSARQEDLVRLIEAARKRLVCLVRYKKSDEDEERSHHFLPGKVIAHHESLYAEGWAVTEDTPTAVRFPMVLAVHRMQGVLLTDRRFEGDLASAGRSGRGSFGVIDGEPFRVAIRFSTRASQYVRERLWSDDQLLTQEQDGLRLEFTTQDVDEVAAWVLSFGKEALALEPLALKERMQNEVRQLAAAYAMPD